MQLPREIRNTLEDLLGASPTADLARAAAIVSERYRRTRGASAPLGIASTLEAEAYLATRFPATFCSVARAIESLAEAVPGFTPQTLLDVGAGPGTAALAAAMRWPDIGQAMLIEPNLHLQNIGARLLRGAVPALKIMWETADISRHPLPEAACDTVLSSYLLNEIAQEKGKAVLRETILKMWRAAKDVLLIIEPGTPEGQNIILEARRILIEAGAFIAAPCPHAHQCPIAARWPAEEKWCHFSVRVERSRLHRQLKQDAVLGYEDEKFSYLVVTRTPASTLAARIVGHPRGTKVVEAEVCTDAGEYKAVKVARSSPDYKALRKAAWGDGVGTANVRE